MEYVIFGASSFGATAYRHLKDKYNICYFCDNQTEKQGKTFEGLYVIPPLELYGKTVIIASTYNIEIAKQLTEMGIKLFYVAYSDETKNIKIKHIDLSKLENLRTDNRKIGLICENNSGSNTYALNKLATDCEYTFSLICENNKDSEYYYNIFTSGVLMKTHEGSSLEGKINIQFWHGIPLKSLGYMNKLRSKYGESKHKVWNSLDGIMSYSTMYSVLMSACYGLMQSKIYITGMPRNDFLFNSNGKNNIARIFENIVGKKLILYAPTFREDTYGIKNGSADAYIYNWEDTDIKELDNFLQRNNCVLIMKLHSMDINNFNSIPLDITNIKTLSDAELSEKDLDMYELLNGFDGLITDYSSIYFDYLLLDRPIIFTPKDLEKYSSDISLLLEPYDFWTPGPKAINMKTLKVEIGKMLSGDDSYAEKRKEITDIFHAYKDGNSTKRVIKALETIIDKKSRENIDV